MHLNAKTSAGAAGPGVWGRSALGELPRNVELRGDRGAAGRAAQNTALLRLRAPWHDDLTSGRDELTNGENIL